MAGDFDYKKGLKQLKVLLRQQELLYLDEFYVLEARLLENLKAERVYGPTEAASSSRARIIAVLNDLTSRADLGVSFNDLCMEEGAALRRQLVDARENLRLIEERKAEYVLKVDIPLQLIKEEQWLRTRIAKLESRVSLGHTTRTAGSDETVNHLERATLAASTETKAGGYEKQPTEPDRGLSGTTITWLHLSDLHHRRPDSRRNRIQLHNSKAVLDKLLGDIRKLIRDDGLRPDFIIFTGDIAYSGHQDEYNRAADFFDRLLQITNLSKQRLFVVPGNHDVDWRAIEEDPITADGCATRLRNRDAVTDFLAPESDRVRATAFLKFKYYAEFIREYFERALSFDEKEYFYVKHLSLYRRVAILGLNSVWMSGFVIKDGEAQDRHNLLVGELQVRDALKRAEGADIRIVLLHHPFDWLQDFDRRDVEPLLLKGCDFILRGHQHQSGIVQLRSPDGTTLVIPAGACYNRREYREGDDGCNGYNFVRLDFSTGKGAIFWRRYDDRRGGRWAADTGLFDEAPLGKCGFDLPESQPHPEPEIWVKSVIETVLITAGDFWIGSDRNDREAHDNEKPQHRVTLPAYEIGKYPVTNVQYRAFVQATGHRPPDHWVGDCAPPGKENHPVVNVSLEDARAFCRWLTKTTGQLYRLPTEEEWEEAARGGLPDHQRYSWGDEWMDGAANTKEAGYHDTTPVDAFAGKNRSPFGAIDMIGNVQEWMNSQYKPYPGSTHEMMVGGTRYVVRGGCYTLPRDCARVSWRGRYTPDALRPYLGFRVAVEVESGEA